jgi:DNA-binding transcriptional MerR regulator
VAQPQPSTSIALTVDELARRADLPVRTIREYQTLRLLPPPTRHGRVGLYGADHVDRLALIARLQRRGYSLAGIKDLLETWDSGAGLPAVLGVDIGPGGIDETPVRLTRAQLDRRLPGLTATSLRRARAVGLVAPDGDSHFLVRSPALLALAADGVNVGIPLPDMLELIGALRADLDHLAGAVADQIVERIWEPLADQGRGSDIEPLLRRGRLLLLQGAASTLADRLGHALLQRAQTTPHGPALHDAIEHTRIGALADADGNINQRRTR